MASSDTPTPPGGATGKEQPAYAAPLRGDSLADLEGQLPSVRDRLAAALQKRTLQSERMREARAGIVALTKEAHAADDADPAAARRYRDERKRKRAAFREAEMAFQRYNQRCTELRAQETDLIRGIKLLQRDRARTRRSRRRYLRFDLKRTMATERRGGPGFLTGLVVGVFVLVCAVGGARYYATRSAGYMPAAAGPGGLRNVIAAPDADTALRALGLQGPDAPAPVRTAPPGALVPESAGMFNRVSTTTRAWVGIPEVYRAPKFLSAVTAADINGDGTPELVFLDFAGQRLLAYSRAQGGYTFAAEIETGAWPNACAAGDVNGDGRADFIVAHGDGTLLALMQGVDGTFSRAPIGRGGAGAAVHLVDLTGDGRLDIAATGWKATEVYEGRADGSFLGPLPVHAEPEQTQLVAADFNHDGVHDIATLAGFDPAAPPRRNALHVTRLGPDLIPLAKTMTQSFEPPLYAIAAVDVGGRGTRGLVGLQFLRRDRQSDTTTYTLILLRGTGAKPFEREELGEITTGHALAVADINADGTLDVLAGMDVFFNVRGVWTRQASRFGTGVPRTYWQLEVTGDAQPDLLAHFPERDAIFVFPAVRRPRSASPRS